MLTVHDATPWVSNSHVEIVAEARVKWLLTELLLWLLDRSDNKWKQDSSKRQEVEARQFDAIL